MDNISPKNPQLAYGKVMKYIQNPIFENFREIPATYRELFYDYANISLRVNYPISFPEFAIMEFHRHLMEKRSQEQKSREKHNTPQVRKVQKKYGRVPYNYPKSRATMGYGDEDYYEWETRTKRKLLQDKKYQEQKKKAEKHKNWDFERQTLRNLYRKRRDPVEPRRTTVNHKSDFNRIMKLDAYRDAKAWMLALSGTEMGIIEKDRQFQDYLRTNMEKLREAYVDAVDDRDKSGFTFAKHVRMHYQMDHIRDDPERDRLLTDLLSKIENLTIGKSFRMNRKNYEFVCTRVSSDEYSIEHSQGNRPIIGNYGTIQEILVEWIWNYRI